MSVVVVVVVVAVVVGLAVAIAVGVVLVVVVVVGAVVAVVPGEVMVGTSLCKGSSLSGEGFGYDLARQNGIDYKLKNECRSSGS